LRYCPLFRITCQPTYQHLCYPESYNANNRRPLAVKTPTLRIYGMPTYRYSMRQGRTLYLYIPSPPTLSGLNVRFSCRRTHKLGTLFSRSRLRLSRVPLVSPTHRIDHVSLQHALLSPMYTPDLASSAMGTMSVRLVNFNARSAYQPQYTGYRVALETHSQPTLPIVPRCKHAMSVGCRCV